ncbi:MAG: rRNA pseudouridine synthase [Bacteroidia bacterium]|nr:rRNA pseudouridine synthase [Bacteroidia bacterium]
MVHRLGFTNNQARDFIQSGNVSIDGITVHENCILDETQEVKIGGSIVRKAKKFSYIKFYKPRGFQSSLSPTVENNLSDFFKDLEGLSIAGRLDKESEGLLLLSNDGKWVEKICNPDSQKEKEYIVELNRTPGPEFFEQFSQGVLLGKHLTRPSICTPISGTKIRIILTEGKNRQIRRMTHKLGYNVTSLLRTRVDVYQLDGLEPASYEYIFT